MSWPYNESSVFFSSSGDPSYAILPPSITMTRSANSVYSIAFVTNTIVLPLLCRYYLIALWKIFFPTYASRALRQSSIKYMSESAYNARAIEIRCFCPPDKFTPFSPISVSSPPDNI